MFKCALRLQAWFGMKVATLDLGWQTMNTVTSSPGQPILELSWAMLKVPVALLKTLWLHTSCWASLESCHSVSRAGGSSVP
eukprot:1269211-Lingulodinium_polyedra.AAC.1